MLTHALLEQHCVALWDYCAQLYQIDAIREACLVAQNRSELNVNLILFLCFARTNSIDVNLERLKNDIAVSQKQVSAHRNQRKQQKSMLPQNDYQLLCQHELELERRQQSLLLLSTIEVNKAENNEDLIRADRELERYLFEYPQLYRQLQVY
ncbi:DUF2390 domain-containing protein [Alginatibacterium sediminis]|uniref:DUF2390 domain-containing protein n=1 Tax=Alginatibacterium sediminis TaxID=2164068 RepID=A0A420EDV0_9ALTE|nr:DUF2390 domain-containing protein [Alginatibacterium sediminis]RKF18851.1 DUF2390 domain-containing protein [Alginatibacterium sediminis]